jgi:chloride channel 7
LLRSTVSLCVIIMEGTGQTELLLPIIVTSVCARTVGNYFNIGLYELAMEMKGVPFLENHIHRKYHIMKVSDVMRTNVVTLR